MSKTLKTLCLGSLGGAIATLFSLPLAWMLGALFLVMSASIAGVRTGVDKRVHVVAIALLGLFIGSRIQAQELLGLVRWYPSVIAMLLYMVMMLAGGYWIFTQAKVGRISAMFCAYPGSMNSALVLAEPARGDLRWIAISHSLRLVTVVSGAALLASLFVDEVTLESDTHWLALSDIAALMLAPLCWWVLRRCRAPLPEFLGPMVAGAIMTNAGVGFSLPAWPVLLAFMILGSSVGARFSGTPWRQVLSVGRFGIAYALFALAAAMLMAWLVASFTSLGFTAVLLALIPGGVGEMAVIATVMGIDPVYVVSHHVLRLLILIFMTPWMVRLASSLGAPETPPPP
ncbi:AbrB family transcriptional regulator [Halomonas sp. 707D7]|uniref:AbrB family transcriptional regulator n=2 Tax=unclassified Halomonas TaxID=2609666 RepID=UPI0020A03727|nr:AbrB family transcriptional regulator [Halomonas sp. 707D7]MCP1313342.1 AbrB family transcriptional regulator [Halomonas sp. 707D7]